MLRFLFEGDAKRWRGKKIGLPNAVEAYLRTHGRPKPSQSVRESTRQMFRAAVTREELVRLEWDRVERFDCGETFTD